MIFGALFIIAVFDAFGKIFTLFLRNTTASGTLIALVD